MTERSNVYSLTDEQRAAMLQFLLHRMPAETRRDLMQAMPMAYVELYPEAAQAVISAVRDGVEELTS